MKVLSILALTTAVFYGITIFRRTRTKMDQENLFSILVCSSLGWWALCDAIFYSAITKESAWRWHQFGAIGWCGFIGVTAWYFLVMAGVDKKMSFVVKCGYWGICAGLTMRFVLVQPTAMAEDLVQSGSGLGWTFVQTYHTIWPFIFLAYLVVYLGGALGYIFLWQRKADQEEVRHMARGFVMLDFVSVSVGFVSIFVIPYFTHYLPPMGSIALLIFLWGYSIELWEYDVAHIELILDPRVILDSSMEPMLITDGTFRILYYNQAMKKLFHDEELLNVGIPDLMDAKERAVFQNLKSTGEHSIHDVSINLPNGEAALMSINQVHTRRHSQNFNIISMHDISKIRDSQIQMAHMAYYDELTGLANRRRLGEVLDLWENNYQMRGDDFMLIFLDLNDFKSINDQYGHDAGDKALIAVADVMRLLSRLNQDEIFRMSGDEFVLLHRMIEQEDMAMILTGMKQAISLIDTSGFAPELAMDASVGACVYSEYQNVRQMMKVADERMYLMKQVYHGR